MADLAIRVKGLKRRFGTVKVLRGLSFEIARGAVVGFIGENGAGKTTTMRILSTLEEPDAGDIEIFGVDLLTHVRALRTKIGWMPDTYDRAPFTTVAEYLDFYARAVGLQHGIRQSRVEAVMQFTELIPLADRFVDALSKGQSQRLSLARTMLGDPELLILDEPAAGLDPKARIEFKHLVRTLASDGKTLFISSHILSELEDMCDELLFIKEGRVLHQGSAAELKEAQSGKRELVVETCGSPDTLLSWLELQPGVSIVEVLRLGARISVDDGSTEQLALLLKRAVTAGIEICEFRRYERKLEDAFVDIISRPNSGGT